MKAAQISQYGGPEALKVVDTDKPKPAEGQVLIEVHASSLNPWDSFVRQGGAQSFMPLDLPVTLGGDIAGVVVEIGPGVTNIKVGDEVYGSAGVTGGSGAFAEYATTTSSKVGPKPKTVNFTEAAAVALTGLSALQAITDHIKLQAGQKILIHGGAGGIGSAAIQLAKHLGAYVATTATGAGLDFAKSLGADEIIDYESQAFDDMLHDYDAVFDTVAGETYKRSFKVLKKNGIIVSMNARPNQQLMDQYGVRAALQSTQATVESLRQLADLIDQGIIKVHVEKTFPLDQIVEAFRARESGGVRGKIAITLKD